MILVVSHNIVKQAKRTAPISNNIHALFNYAELAKLNDREINNLYKTLFTVYFYKPENVQYLTLEVPAASAKSGFKVAQEMSKTTQSKADFNLLPALKTLHIPTLIIQGDNDIVPADAAQRIKDAIPNAQILYLHHCGHFAYIEKPQELFTAIRAFLKNTNKTLPHAP